MKICFVPRKGRNFMKSTFARGEEYHGENTIMDVLGRLLYEDLKILYRDLIWRCEDQYFF
jgi:hypothetical protein